MILPATAVREARSMAWKMALGYAAGAVVWIVVTDSVEHSLGLPGPLLTVVNAAKSGVFVIVTTLLLYSLARRFLTLTAFSHEQYRQAQEELRLRERAIQQAYIDVLAAVTGGKLILMWPDEVPNYLGDPVVEACAIDEPGQLAAARARIAPALEALSAKDEALLAANEAITNVLKHAGGGTYGVRRTGSAVQVVVTDQGPGIDFHTIPRATLIAGYSTKPSLGIGFTIMFDAAERVLLATETGSTTLVLEFPFKPAAEGTPVSEPAGELEPIASLGSTAPAESTRDSIERG